MNDRPTALGSTAGVLLAYSSSMLVAKPINMAPLRDWYGEWEPYHTEVHLLRETPRRAHAEDSAQHAAEGEDSSNNGGIIGGAIGGFGLEGKAQVPALEAAETRTVTRGRPTTWRK